MRTTRLTPAEEGIADQIAVTATDALASNEASIGVAAAVMLQIAAGCQAHLEGVKDVVAVIGDEHGTEAQVIEMEEAMVVLRLALKRVMQISQETGGAL